MEDAELNRAALLEILEGIQRTQVNFMVFMKSSHKRMEGSLERIEMMSDILEQTVALLRIKQTVKDAEFVTNMTNMVAACRKYVIEERLHMENQKQKASELDAPQ